MRFSAAALSTTLLILCSVSPMACHAQNERERAVREDKEKLELDETWIYDDLDEAMANARAARKPVMVLIRCLP